MFFHVYADLMALAKSTTLNKSALDMTYHYLELLTFLREIQQYPDTLLNRQYQVFLSERRLYGDDSHVNHRLHEKSEPAHKCLSKSEESDKDLLHPLIVAGAAAMEMKLCEYAKDYLPGGLYWNPNPHVREIMTKLKPTNDLCESLLGLNDYLSGAMPNMHQMTRSNMIQVKKNKTIKWLHDLPNTEQDKEGGRVSCGKESPSIQARLQTRSTSPKISYMNYLGLTLPGNPVRDLPVQCHFQ